MKLPRSWIDRGFKALNAFHHTVLRVSRGRLGARAFGMEVIELTTVGRRTGRPHRTTLTVPVGDTHRVVLVASKGGDDRDPDWYRNILAHGDVEVLRGGNRHEMSARPASAEERAALWPQVVAAYRPYASYQRRSSREIPLVVCTAVTAPG